ncbi:NAD(P)/FAD-dependent oxidoreductase [Sphingomonas naphthae]|uniref:NAD(P)/FAD-dependent oxidoreductase n=1 Tax=Sphingomonas naphthae TaxID=1813468 RepID=A0ABY7TJU9_9SPHN|nr:NAD(P)/FAD-dependent oxidoreductase [Sphingomonas naphthae]WCT73501.1 NAD(P)/FAD-dependent oxidoreductase [Sphingomonas naphthae]
MQTIVTCGPSQTPDDIDIPALRARYRQERDKRLRPEGGDQYAKAADGLKEFAEVDPHTPPQAREPIAPEIDVAIIGGGFSGLMAGVRLKQQGVTDFRIIDAAGDFGGVWYWNRYPGIQCDNESYCYFPLLEEVGYVPKSRFSDGTEIQEHCRRIGTHFDLYGNTLFGTSVSSMQWDDGLQRWRIGTNHGDDVRARFVIMCVGSTNKPKLPGIPGITDFKGHSFHSARWDYDYTGGSWEDPTLDKLADKRVAVIGTGASAIQIVPFVGKYAKKLLVFQRTPSSVDRRGNVPTDPDWAANLGPGWQQERQRNFHQWSFEFLPPGKVAEDAICDFWTEINRNMATRLEAIGEELPLEQILAMREEEDYRVMERLRRRIASIVTDPATAESLKPYYRMGCKRPCSNDTYLETFNLPNVKLIDVSDCQGVERITEKGIVANGVEYEVDCIIYASGFEVTTKLDRRLGIEPYAGRDGLSLYDHWRDGLKTFHGMTSHGFPNHFYTGFTQAGAGGNITAMYDQQVSHIAWIVKEALARGAAVIEPTREAQEGWVRTIHETAVDISDFLLECTPGYWNGEGGGAGADEERRKKLKFIFGEPYGPGFYAFDTLLQEWRDEGSMAGLELTPPVAANDAAEPESVA